MGKVIVTDTYLSNIASAIRGRAGTASLYTPAQMASAIANLPSGVSVSALSVSANGTYSAPSGYAYDPVTVDVQGGGGGGNEDAIIERTLSETYENANVTKIGYYAFASCIKLRSVNFQNVTIINGGAFAFCSSLLTVSIPNCTSIDYSAFTGTKIVSVNWPNITYVGPSAFSNCAYLKYVNFPSVSVIRECAFMGCSSLSQIIASNVTSLSRSAFWGCKSLQSVDFPSVTSIMDGTFVNCSALSLVNLPAVTFISTLAFSYCTSLSVLSFPLLKTISGSSAFFHCHKLLSLYLLGSSVATLSNGRTVFASTPISTYTTSTGGVYGSIYVRASLYNSWITTANWSYYSSRFVSLTDEEIAALDAQ